MAAGRSCGGSLDEITWHYYLTVKKAVFNNNKAQKGNKFVTLRGIIVMDAAIFFPYIGGMFSEVCRKPLRSCDWDKTLIKLIMLGTIQQ